MAGMAAPNAASTSPPAPRFGITPGCRFRSAGCWCATRRVRKSRRPSCAPIWTPTPWTSCAGSSAAGGLRPPSRKPAAISAWKPSGNRSEEHTSELQSHSDLHSFPTRRSSDLDADPVDILRWFVRRWRVETTFEEARRHLGLETQRQWSDLAILRTTPALLGLFSLVTLWATQLEAAQGLLPEWVRWYPKHAPTFSDALALVRRELWTSPTFAASRHHRDAPKLSADVLSRLLLIACRPP